jgi:hypothetical protein
MRLAGGAFAFFFALAGQVNAAPKAVFSGKSTHRFFEYTESKDKDSGQDHWFMAQQKIEFDSNFSSRIQAYAYAGNSRGDLYQATDVYEPRNQISEAWPGDVYLQASGGPVLFKLGYQQISWQEGVGLSYTNFINARDYRASLFDPPDQVYRSAPAANMILSGEHLSLQMVYLPFSQFNQSPPFSRAGIGQLPLLPNQKIELQSPPRYRKADEHGARLTWAGEGFDFSVFYFSLLDRKPIYEISPESDLTKVKLNGLQKPMTTAGATATLNLADFLIRLEYMEIPKRQYNQFTGAALNALEFKETAYTIGIDSPNWQSVSFSLQYSESLLGIDQEVAGLERRKKESLSFASFNYSFGSDRVLRFMGLYREVDRSIFGRAGYTWPVSKSVDMEIGYEGSNGNLVSQGKALQELSKGFLQVNHTF